MLPLNNNKGEHGFDNEVMDMKALFRAVGPDFQRNLMVDPFELVDVYPLMCHLLGIYPEVNDGHLDNTKHMLVPKKNRGMCSPPLSTFIYFLDSTLAETDLSKHLQTLYDV